MPALTAAALVIIGKILAAASQLITDYRQLTIWVNQVIVLKFRCTPRAAQTAEKCSQTGPIWGLSGGNQGGTTLNSTLAFTRADA